VATNLRLRPDAEAALRDRAARTGRSQQELIRAAVDRYLGLGAREVPQSESELLIAGGAVLPARTPYRPGEKFVDLPSDVTTADLLDRDERV